MEIDMPTIAVPLIALSIGETLYAFKDVDVLVWVYEKSGNSLRITQPIHVNVSRLLRTLSTIKYYVPEWPRVVHECFLSNDDGPAVLAAMTEAIINDNIDVEIYKLTRLITAFLAKFLANNQDTECKRSANLMNKLIESLL